LELDRDIDPLVVSRRIIIQDGQASIEALPYAGCKLSYTLDYPGHPLAQGSYDFEMSEENYLREIAPARTFAIRPEAERMLAAGLGKGANTQNTVVVDGDRAVDTNLRFPNEPVRHKILDLIGDLYVLGRPLQAHVIARCSGHRANRMLALELMNS
jgi:UDP-3-O-acyl-N-acetylglucosamine deacetylase